MQDKDFDLSNMTIKVPKNLKKDFREAISFSEHFDNVHEAIASYMIKTVGEYNRSNRQASKSI